MTLVPGATNFESPGLRGRIDGLAGRTFSACRVDAGYWHLHVALCHSDGTQCVFSTQEHNVAPRFDVYTIDWKPDDEARSTGVERKLPLPILVSAIHGLWREEWIERGASGTTVGTEPYTQYAGRTGSRTAEAVAAARVLAGLMLEGAGGRIAIVASPSAPLNVDPLLGDALDAALDDYAIEPLAP
jgi:hypothetical protein